MKDDSIPAFPMAVDCSKDSRTEYQVGMSLRDYFAAAALTGMLAGRLPGKYAKNCDVSDYTGSAYLIADEMLKARGQ